MHASVYTSSCVCVRAIQMLEVVFRNEFEANKIILSIKSRS